MRTDTVDDQRQQQEHCTPTQIAELRSASTGFCETRAISQEPSPMLSLTTTTRARYSATEPPAASIAARAPFVATRPFTVILRVSSPVLIIRALVKSTPSRPACFKANKSTSSTGSFSRSDKRSEERREGKSVDLG